MMPEVPSALYFADGLVITSIFSIMSAVIVPSAPPPLLAITEGFPLIKIYTPELPRRLIYPSMFTYTEGTLFNTSKALAPVLLKSLPTLKTRLSNLNSVVDLSASITTSSRFLLSATNSTVPSSTLFFPSVRFLIVFFLRIL